MICVGGRCLLLCAQPVFRTPQGTATNFLGLLHLSQSTYQCLWLLQLLIVLLHFHLPLLLLLLLTVLVLLPLLLLLRSLDQQGAPHHHHDDVNRELPLLLMNIAASRLDFARIVSCLWPSTRIRAGPASRISTIPKVLGDYQSPHVQI